MINLLKKCPMTIACLDGRLAANLLYGKHPLTVPLNAKPTLKDAT